MDLVLVLCLSLSPSLAPHASLGASGHPSEVTELMALLLGGPDRDRGGHAVAAVGMAVIP
jgi:hypothetical protein